MATDRNTLIRKIHVARRQLFDEDEATYRAALAVATDKNSLKAMGAPELDKVIDHFKTLGWKDKPAKKAKSRNYSDDPMVRKVWALWGQLRELGGLENANKHALDAYVERMTSGADNGPRVSAIEWASYGQVSWIIECLKRWLYRARIDAAVKECEPYKRLSYRMLMAICDQIVPDGAHYEPISGGVMLELVKKHGWKEGAELYLYKERSR